MHDKELCVSGVTYNDTNQSGMNEDNKHDNIDVFNVFVFQCI